MLADSVKITTGNVNALAGLKNDTRYIQISTPIQPGNSGGPVVDRDGFLLGITSATFSKQAADLQPTRPRRRRT
nr:serine protease [Sinorhizobium terangae]